MDYKKAEVWNEWNEIKQQFEEIANNAIKLAEQIDCSTENFMRGLEVIMSKLEKRWEMARGR